MLQLFDKYFLALVLIHGFVVRIIDLNRYKKEQKDNLSKKAQVISSGIMILAVTLFIIKKITE